MENFLGGYLAQILTVLLLAFAAFLGTQCKNLYRRYVNTEVKQAVCRTAVRFVEQVYKDLHGPQKLLQAMKKASELLANYGITISEEELIAMIEAAVNEFNDNFNKKDAGTHGAHEQVTDGKAEEPGPDIEELLAESVSGEAPA